MNLELYLMAAEFIDSSDPDVQAFAKITTAGTDDAVSRAVKLYYAVRDQILYDPYYAGEARSYFRASDCLRAQRGFCIPKAALLAATARSVGIPARVAYADVRNHLSTKKLIEMLGSDLFIWHSLTELHLEGRWVKATPAFNASLCRRFGVGNTIRSSRSTTTEAGGTWSMSRSGVTTLTCPTTQSSPTSRVHTPAG